MVKPRLNAYADRGYFNGPQIKQCDEENITAFVPKPLTSGAKYEGRFDKRDFFYIAKDDEYRCPAGQRAIYRFTREENGLQIDRYWSSACPQCPMKPQCTPSDYSGVLTRPRPGRAEFAPIEVITCHCRMTETE